MIRHLLLLPILCVAVFLTAPAASAQAPKFGDWYENASELGFKVRMPKDWAFIPPAPDEPNLIGKYDPTSTKAINVGGKQMGLHAWVVAFDLRESESAGEGGADTRQEKIQKARRASKFEKDLPSWLKQYLPGNSFEVESEKELSIHKTPATEFIFEAKIDSTDAYKVYAMLYRLEEGLEVAVVFNGPGDGKKWRKFESIYRRMAKSFKRVEIKKTDNSDELADMSPLRAKKKAALLEEVERTPGWTLYETPNYFVISNKDDRQFIKELLERLEAIRAVYEEHYDADEARAIRAAAQKADDEEKAQEGDKDKPEERRTTTVADPMEMSRTSVVRVCASKGQYHSYGGPPSSAGYWNNIDEELVIYEDKPRSRTWATLNHEAFHQYIFYFYGNISPHSWYNEGTGDFYSGYKYKNKKFTLKPFDWRVGTIKTAVREGTYVPLKKIVRYKQSEYYATAQLCYAQGWSFIYFLRTGKKKASHWNDDWDSILDTYLKTLAATGDLEASVDKAFAGVDWDELEEAWKEYTK